MIPVNHDALYGHPEAETFPGLVIFRFDAPIIFINASYLTEQVRQCISAAQTPVREVLFPAQQINQLDSTGANQLGRLQAELEAKGITFSFAETKSALRDAMRRTGLEEKIGAGHFYKSVHEGVQAFQGRSMP